MFHCTRWAGLSSRANFFYAGAMSKAGRQGGGAAGGRVMSRHMRRWAGGVFVVLLVAVVLVGRMGWLGSVPGSDQQRYHGRVFAVVKVVDGDTLDLDVADAKSGKDTTRVRLWGVDTPETKHPRHGAMYFGAEASEFARRLALGKQVTVKLEPFEKSRGKYGRLLAYIHLPDGKILNEELLSGGYAYADERFRHVMKGRYLQLQKEAQREKRGLWREVRPEQWPEWYRKRHGR